MFRAFLSTFPPQSNMNVDRIYMKAAFTTWHQVAFVAYTSYLPHASCPFYTFSPQNNMKIDIGLLEKCLYQVVPSGIRIHMSPLTSILVYFLLLLAFFTTFPSASASASAAVSSFTPRFRDFVDLDLFRSFSLGNQYWDQRGDNI